MQLRIDLSGLNAAVAEMFLFEEAGIVVIRHFLQLLQKNDRDAQAWQDLMDFFRMYRFTVF